MSVQSTKLDNLSQSVIDLEAHTNAPKIGQILLDSGKVVSGDEQRILNVQERMGLRYGEAAVELKLVKPVDVDEALAKQFSYAYLRKDDGSLSKELVAAYEPFSAAVESLRAVRSRLMLQWSGSERRVISIVSPGNREGRSLLAANLALVFSQLGERTLLIDADLRRSQQHTLFNVPNDRGLGSALAGIDQRVQIKGIPLFDNMYVLASGPAVPNPQELLSRQTFVVLLEKVIQNFDVVIIDTPAGQLNADAEIVAARAREALVVARKEHTNLPGLTKFCNRLSGAGVKVVGSVLNDY